jgi:flavin-dependent dehydrogenase
MGSQRTPVPDDPAYLHGQVCERSVFDHALIRQLEKHPGITLYQGTRITGIDHGSSGIECQTGQGILLRGQIAVGAFGTGTGLLEMLAGNPVPAGVQAFAIRGYFRNVTGFREDHAIELFFADELLPGYLWLFPLPGDRANAGIYFPSLEQRKHFKDPVALFRQITEKYPQLKKRFRDAVPEGPMKGGTLPVWTSHQKLSGERYMLCGDAASLVDPFTGEGIANAILSGRIAAETIKSCFSVRDFSAESLSSYDKAVYGQLGEELSTSRMLLDMLKPSPEKVRLKSYRISVDRMLEQLSTTYWDIGLRKKVMQDFTPAAGPPRKGPALRIPGNWAIFRKRSR